MGDSLFCEWHSYGVGLFLKRKGRATVHYIIRIVKGMYEATNNEIFFASFIGRTSAEYQRIKVFPTPMVTSVSRGCVRAGFVYLPLFFSPLSRTKRGHEQGRI